MKFKNFGPKFPKKFTIRYSERFPRCDRDKECNSDSLSGVRPANYRDNSCDNRQLGA